ncbi:M24 family metallopeptidase [Sphingomonas corticis]|jgi:Xaa-Pro aminopeptidase|uniref:Aminopeptidase P family protein n=1 Tax=Sphingomonas corticis TaxID=2722791 RepID=A0ABX1CRS1_9SPHN|nr:Xaa-Pro peptidase family protein [Sphingomonas corticis]NJR79353.1 aminopeptidase P family protein [Sphingomonas corticis]
MHFAPSRRRVLAAAALMPLAGVLRAAEPDLSGLSDITAGAVPIGVAERTGRLRRAQALMKAAGIGAIVIEPGASLIYFTGVRWGRSERLTCAVIPMEGEPCIVTPFFEEPSVRLSLAVPAQVRTWNEDEEPTRVIAGFLKDRGLSRRPVGIEETVRFFAVDRLRRAAPDARLVSADAVVRGCRMRKTPAEIALMQLATDVTVAAYRFVHPRVEPGMTGADVGALMSAATRRLGGAPEFSMALVGPDAALPHGGTAPRRIAKGDVVLMDCGCTVEGYQSDVSRTFVVGTPPAEVRRVWSEVARGQQVAFAAARIGTPAGAVDDAVRRHYETLGYGPGYRLPGLSHRTGHGIGMEGHEPVNLVHGEATPLAEGMCFSDEPGLYLPGRFGVRLEDCFHMTAAGPKWFSEPPASIERPV